ncbi:HHE domain-containing protein [Phellopilus nigrolimitatus]|nr:HHE domain-containing protein [Phellopilus nigrolimitatus]
MSTPVGTGTSSGPLTDKIKEDHQEMYEYYDLYKKAGKQGDRDAQERWARQLIWEVARHAVGEEIVVYPLMEKHLGAEGRKLADQDRADHQFVKEKLYKLESLTPGAADYDSLLDKVMAHLHEHNDSEEIKDLPLLEPAIGADASKTAATSFSRTKKFVPTRTHPSAPNRPPLETLAGFLAAPIDKLQDAFSKFPTEEMKEQAEN